MINDLLGHVVGITDHVRLKVGVEVLGNVIELVMGL